MARTKLTKRARDAKQQEAVKRRQRQTASEKEMRMAESKRDMETSTMEMLKSGPSFHNLFRKNK